MPTYTTSGGVQRELTSWPVMVDGVSRELDCMAAAVDGVQRETFSADRTDPVFENNDWSAIIAACRSGSVPDAWLVGDSKPMTVNGVDYQIDIIGKNHDAYADGSGTAPLTLQMHDCYGAKCAMHSVSTNVYGWTECNMRSTQLPGILALMPAEVQAGVKEVNKLTSAGRRSSVINTTADKLFLLSEVEVLGTTNRTFSGEGSQYAYYAAGNSAEKSFGGRACAWWTRSPYKSDTRSFCCVKAADKTGVVTSGSYDADSSYGVSIAFCF